MNDLTNALDTTEYHDDGRVYLRKLTPEDVTDRYLSWFRDPIVTEYLDARNLSRDDVVSYMVDGHASGLHIMYGIFDCETRTHIGNVKIGPIVWRHETGGVVTFIGERTYWGKGYAREAIKIGTRLAFEQLNLRKLTDGVAEGNTGSVKAYTAAGWVVEAQLKGHHLIDGDPRDRIVISCFNPKFFPDTAG